MLKRILNWMFPTVTVYPATLTYERRLQEAMAGSYGARDTVRDWMGR